MNNNQIFAMCVRFFGKWKKVQKNQITLIEKLNTGGTGSLFEIKRECERRGLPFSFNIIRHSDYEVSPGNFFGLILLFTKKAYRMAISSHIFLNDNFMPLAYMKLPSETKVVQLWHGMGSFKKFGGSSETDRAVLAELEAASANTTHILASSENIRDNYAEAFIVPPEKVLCIGCPQADYYFRKHDFTKKRAQLEEKYPAMKGKKLILYAPTFRDDEERDRELLNAFDFAAFEERLGGEYCLMVRLHPQIQSASVPDSVVDMTDYPNVRELLCLTDILIADYSSIAVEYSLLNRPVFLYAFDKEWYLSRDRGFYFDFEETAPGPIAETMEELIAGIEEKKWDMERVEKFAHLHNDFFDDQSAKRIVDYYFGPEKKMLVGDPGPDAFFEDFTPVGRRGGRRYAGGSGKLPDKWASEDAKEAVSRWEQERKKERKEKQRRRQEKERLAARKPGSAGQPGGAQRPGSAGKAGGAGKTERTAGMGSAGQPGDAQRPGSAGQPGDAQRPGSAGKPENQERTEGKRHTMKVIVGLGNPTDEYKGTRHNVGFMAIDRIAEANHIAINQHKFKAMTGSGFIGGQKVLLVKPLTYMNLSGESVRPVVDFYKIDLSDLLVIYDDISLEPGLLRIRTKGSAGGHNGMKSIIKHLGGDAFPRIRVGIGGEKHPGQDLADYVLGHFKEEEKEPLSEALDKAAQAAEMFAADDLAEAMNRFSVGKKKRAKKQKGETETVEKTEKTRKPDKTEETEKTGKQDKTEEAKKTE